MNAVLRPDAELFAGDLRYFIELYTSSMNYEEIESRLKVYGTQDITVNKAKTADKASSSMDAYIRS